MKSSFQVKVPKMKGATSELSAAVESISREPLSTLGNANQSLPTDIQKAKKKEKKEVTAVTHEERSAAEKMDGRDIVRYMEQLGGKLDDITGDGEDEKKSKGRRGSGHKERATTPLKEKLLKSWGGSYLDRLDVVVGVGNGEGGQDQARAEVFKPMFMQPPQSEQSLPLPSQQRVAKQDKPDGTKKSTAAAEIEKKRAKVKTQGGGVKTVSRVKSPTMPPPLAPTWVTSVALDSKAAAAASTGKKRSRAEVSNQLLPVEVEGDDPRAKVTKLEVTLANLRRDRKEVEDQFAVALRLKDQELQKATARAAELEGRVKGLTRKAKEAIKGAAEAKKAIENLMIALNSEM